MRKWMKPGIALAAVLLALAAGSAAYAVWDAADGGDETANTRETDPDTANTRLVSDGADDGGQDGGAFAICIEGATDCVDTPLGPDDQQLCPEEGCDTDADCAADGPHCGADVLDPGFSCEPGLTLDECLPDGLPADYECVTLESDPVQVKCYPLDCGVTILPAPVDPQTADDIAAAEEAACDPQVDPCYPEPESDARCLPPDCAVSSDGGVACPGSEPCDPSGGDCSSSAGCAEDDPSLVHCVDPACPPEECARDDSGAGSDGVEPSEVEPLPAEEH